MSVFFKFFGWFFMLPLFGLRAESHLDRLVEYDKETCIEVLQTATLSELWNYFLKNQTELYFSHEAEWLSQKDCWAKAQNILELGSGNGTYLHQFGCAWQSSGKGNLF